MSAHPQALLFIIGGSLAAIALAVVVALSISTTQTTAPSVDFNPVSSPTAGALGIHEPTQSATLPKGKTLASFSYNTNPPTSGPGATKLPSAYVATKPLSKADVAALLQKGNVVIAYGPHTPAATLTAVKAFAKKTDSGSATVSQRLSAGDGIVVTPWTSLPAGQIDLLAWTRLWQQQAWSQPNAQSFTNAFLGNPKNVAQ